MKRIRFRRPPRGWWTGPGYLKHHCKPPAMPRRAPSGLIHRCECGNEWTWTAKP